jgi:hypothetical protein
MKKVVAQDRKHLIPFATRGTLQVRFEENDGKGFFHRALKTAIIPPSSQIGMADAACIQSGRGSV